MRILHVLHSLDARSGGSLSAALSFIEATKILGWTADIAGTIDKHGQPHADLGRNTDKVHIFQARETALRFSVGLYKFLKGSARKYDLIHIHSLYRFPMTFAAWAAQAQGVPYVIEPHGVLAEFYWNMPTRGIFRKLYRRMFDFDAIAKSDGLIVSSPLEGEHATKRFGAIKQYMVPLASDYPPLEDDLLAGRFAARQRLGLGGGPVFLYLGRISATKGVLETLEGFQLFRTHTPTAELLVCGADDEGIMRSSGFAMGTTSKGVRYVGIVSGVVKHDALRASQALILPSPAENFSIVALEALAMGMPVIGTREVGLLAREADSPLAYFIAELDRESVATEMGRVLSCTSNLAEAERVREKYSVKNMSDAVRMCYEEIVFPRNCAVN